MPRIRALDEPVTIHLDGEPIVADRGEPAVAALVGAGRIALARSPKFHRPRGPACLRAACDGCLARVDGIPNVMTCRVPAAEGMRIETQNVLGSRDTDLLRVADWFFPEGMDHHELFAGVPGLQQVLGGFARRVAGLGRLPTGQPPAPQTARRRDVDVLVVGSGPSGMASALELAARGRAVEVVDDDLDWGGSARIFPDPAVWSDLLAEFGAAIARGAIAVRTRTTAAGVYGDDVLVASEATAALEVVRARTLVLAPGAHDGAAAFRGNDVPGVMSARAACRLLAHGVVPGDAIAVVVPDGGGPFGAAYARARPETPLVAGVPESVRGSHRVKGAVIAAAGATRDLACDTLLVDAPRAPAYELCAQSGATLRREPRGFVVDAPDGKIRPGVFAAGEVVGPPLDPAAVRAAARRIAAAT